MTTKTGLIIVACLIIFILIRVNIAFNYQDTFQQGLNEQFNLPTAFTGTLPCEGCPEANYELRLEEGKYTEFNIYVDGASQNHSNTGVWQRSGDTLILHSDNSNNQKRFRILENNLKPLFVNSAEVSEGIAENYQLTRNTEFKSILDRHQELRRNGVKFVGNGNEPFWAFHVFDGDTLVYMKPELEIKSSTLEIYQDSTGVQYVATFSSDLELSIHAEEQFCQDTMSGFTYTHHVTIRENGAENTGCGRFL